MATRRSCRQPLRHSEPSFRHPQETKSAGNGVATAAQPTVVVAVSAPAAKTDTTPAVQTLAKTNSGDNGNSAKVADNKGSGNGKNNASTPTVTTTPATTTAATTTTSAPTPPPTVTTPAAAPPTAQSADNGKGNNKDSKADNSGGKSGNNGGDNSAQDGNGKKK